MSLPTSEALRFSDVQLSQASKNLAYVERRQVWMEEQNDRRSALQWEQKEINQETDNNWKRMELERSREADNKGESCDDKD